jgi:hypothetical protein
MRPALVFSVPGTGTRFTVALLQAFGYVLGTNLSQIHSLVDKGKHAQDMERLRIAKADGVAAVIPLRSPVASFLTRRKVTAGQTQDEKDEKARERTLRYWQTLRDWMHQFDHVLFPIEEVQTPRVDRIARVARHLNVAFEPESFVWCKVGSWPGEAPDVDVSFLSELSLWYEGLIKTYEEGR